LEANLLEPRGYFGNSVTKIFLGGFTVVSCIRRQIGAGFSSWEGSAVLQGYGKFRDDGIYGPVRERKSERERESG
jgi:hypothetical protein